MADILLQQLDAMQGEPSRSFLVSLSQALRKSKLRRPDVIVKFANQLVSASSSQDVWNTYESIFLSALDVGDIGLATTYLAKLQTKFPKSSRVQRLLAMKFEALGEYDKAIAQYDKLLAENPGNILAMKRKASLRRSQGQLSEAVTILHEIIRLWPADSGVWIELCDIHLSQSDIASAAFCMEELILMEPVNAPAHTRLADCYYSLGSYDNFVKARKHYALSLDYQGPASNLRALYGLIKTSKAVSSDANSGKPGNRADTLVNNELGRWAQEQLAEVANKCGPTSVVAVMANVLK